MAVVEEFDYLCRLCATKTGILMGLPIFEAGDQMRNIDKKIAACLPVQVKSCTNSSNFTAILSALSSPPLSNLTINRGRKLVQGFTNSS